MIEHKHMYIFDLDGTLALIDHRTHFVRDGNKQWKEFFEACDKDEPNWNVIEVFKSLVLAGETIEIWSGRSDEVREKTEAWLDRYLTCIDYWDRKLPGSSFLKRMRPANDYQKDSLLKKSWLDEEQAKGNKIIAVFDDRQQVVDMWRDNGVSCFQVAPGDFDAKRDESVFPAKIYMMIGPSGAGKSAYLDSDGIDARSIVSSDAIREQIWGNRNHPNCFTPEGLRRTFSAFHNQIKARADAGMDVWIDATNIKRRDRMSIVDFVDPNRVHDWTYVIIDRPLDEKLATMDQQNPDIVRKHHQTFQSSKKDALNGDGFAKVIDERKV